MVLTVIQHWKMVCLEQLVWLKMLILASINILDMVLDLKENDFSVGNGISINLIIIGNKQIDNKKKCYFNSCYSC